MSHVKTRGTTGKYHGMFDKLFSAVSVYRDSIRSARIALQEREEAIKGNYKPDSKLIPIELEKARKAFKESCAESKEAAEKQINKEFANYRSLIKQKVSFPLASHIADLRLMASFDDLSQQEFDLVCSRFIINGTGNYWDLRMLDALAREQGLKLPDGVSFSNISRQFAALDMLERNIKLFINGGNASSLIGERTEQIIEPYDGTDGSYLGNLAVSDEKFWDAENLFFLESTLPVSRISGFPLIPEEDPFRTIQ